MSCPSHNTSRTSFRCSDACPARPGPSQVFPVARKFYLDAISFSEMRAISTLQTMRQPEGEVFLIDDVEAAERAEKSIDEFITRRARNKAEANEEEAELRAVARRIRDKRRRENRMAWIDYYEHMNRLHLSLAADHADRRSRLMLEGGYEPEESPGPEAA